MESRWTLSALCLSKPKLQIWDLGSHIEWEIAELELKRTMLLLTKATIFYASHLGPKGFFVTPIFGSIHSSNGEIYA